MSWKDLVQTERETVVAPWVGGKILRLGSRTWKIASPLPRDYGWYKWFLSGRLTTLCKDGSVTPDLDKLKWFDTGYLAGDFFFSNSLRSTGALRDGRKVHLLEDGMDPFTRVKVGRMFEDGPLFLVEEEMPLGPEIEVFEAFEDGKDSVSDLKEVTPALNCAFQVEVFRREEVKRLRLEAEKRAKEEVERLAKEARREELLQAHGDGAMRRELAKVDFEEAARKALAIGGAELLSTRKGNKDEMVVRFRYDGQRFRVTCHKVTMRIIDAGICLVDHGDNEKAYDDYFTLESLPSVIKEAIQLGKLVVWNR